MPCAITSGYALDCRDTVGGIKNLYVTELASVSTVSENASGFVTAISMTPTKKFYKYELEPRGTNDATQNIQADLAAGTVSYEHIVNANFVKMKYETSYKLQLLIKNRCVIIVETKSGQYFMYGKENGMQVNGGTVMTGQAMNEFNGYTIPFNGMERTMAQEVDSSIIAGLI